MSIKQKLILLFMVTINVMATVTFNVMADDALRPSGNAVSLGNIKNYSILIPEMATDQEKFSAKMLADYLEKIFKTKLPVVQEPQAVKGGIISIGNTVCAKTGGIAPDSREQAYKLAVSDGKLYILGGSRGPIYGVIALLEEDLGCRWYAISDAPVIPVRSNGELTVVPRSYAPPFEIREILYSDAFNNQWAAFNRLQPLSPFTVIPSESGGGLASASFKYFIHTYDQLVPADKYFIDHPEYFPLLHGKRYRSSQRDGQLCYSSPELAGVIAAKIEDDISQHTGTRIYGVSENDNINDNCECPSCQEIIKMDGVAGAQLYLANAVATKLAVKYPDIKITTLAYHGSQKPPKNIKPGTGTVMIYAPIYLRMPDMLRPIGGIRDISDELAGWHKIASGIYLWDYVDCILSAPMPFPNFDALNGGWQYLIDNGVTGVFLQGCYRGHASLGELKSWLFAKKLWNPQWSQDGLIEEFIASYYGPAAVKMAEYVALQRQEWTNFNRTRKTGECFKFSDTAVDKMHKLLNSALSHCGDKVDYQVKIEREMLPLLCLFLDVTPRSNTAEQYAAALKQAESLITKLKVKTLGEGLTTDAYLQKCRDKLKNATNENGLPKYSKNSITIKKPSCLVAKYLPDADAALGHAARQPGSKHWGVQWPYADFLDLMKPGKNYVARLRVKAELKGNVGKNGELFAFGKYTNATKNVAFPVKFSPDENGQYRWVELFKLRYVTPSAIGYLYCVPGTSIGKDEAIWYDYLEIVPEDEFKNAELAAKLPVINI